MTFFPFFILFLVIFFIAGMQQRRTRDRLIRVYGKLDRVLKHMQEVHIDFFRSRDVLKHFRAQDICDLMERQLDTELKEMK